MEPSEKDLPEFLSYLPVLTICAFIFGIIDLGVYYSYFQFDVFQFMNISEMLPMVIRDAVSFAIIALPLSVIIRKSPGIDSHILGTQKDPKHTNYRPWVIRNWGMLIGGSFILSTLYQIIKCRIPLSGGFLIIDIILAIIVLRKMPNYIKRLYAEHANETQVYRRILMIQLGLLLVFCSIFSGARKLLIVEDPKVRDKISVITSKDTINTTNHYYFIGKTPSQVFYYDEKRAEVDIYQTSDLKKIVYHR